MRRTWRSSCRRRRCLSCVPGPELDEVMACLHTKVKYLIRQMEWLGIEQPDMCPGDEFLDGIEDDEDWFGNFL